MKRALDLSLAIVGLIVFAPLLLAISAAIWLAMGRPVLFRQLRGGCGGGTFELLKFRTMRGGPGSDQSRLTSLGSWLRISSLDELPELWNVVRGEMSLVGPRPLLAEYLDFYSDRQKRRHTLRPGITGLAQVEGRNALNWDARFEKDLFYVDNRSLALDLRILCRTVLTVMTARGSPAVQDTAFGPAWPIELANVQPMDGYGESTPSSSRVAGVRRTRVAGLADARPAGIRKTY
jgi:lipopolysaccharide/colanic/teichoic acid biosynthesis glycosyltransferase